MADSAPPRRQFLSGLAASSLALVPLAADATHPADAAVVAKAVLARDLLRASRLAGERVVSIDNEVTTACRALPEPGPSRSEITDACVRVLNAFPELTPEVDRAVTVKRQELERRLQAEREAVEQRRDEIARAHGLAEAIALDARLIRELEVLLPALAAMPSASVAGVIAKAAVFGDEPVDVLADEQVAFACSVLHELATFGGARETV